MFALSSVAAKKKALLRWGNDLLWHRWPMMIWPLTRAFRNAHGRYPNLLHPHSLNEKVLYRMLFDRRPHLRILAGKLESREFVRRRTASDRYLIPLHGVLDRAEEIRSLTLPRQFILKANRGSHMFHTHRGETPPDLDALEDLCRGWLAFHYGKNRREWIYEGVESKVLVEELLLDEQGRCPTDYKFFCFNGEPRWLRTCEDRHGEAATYTMFRTDWTVIEEETPCEGVGILPPPARPACLDEMLELARTLSRGTDMLRVDLYEHRGRVYFGELTNTPDAGRLRYHPHELDLYLGSFWKLDTRSPLVD